MSSAVRRPATTAPDAFISSISSLGPARTARRTPRWSEPIVQPVIIIAAEEISWIGDIPIERHRHVEH
jgi:hypothetical protein